MKTLDDIHQLEETDLTPEAGFSVVDKRKFIAARKLLKDADYIETNGVEVKRARVLFDYDKVKANQLSIKEGDVVCDVFCHIQCDEFLAVCMLTDHEFLSVLGDYRLLWTMTLRRGGKSQIKRVTKAQCHLITSRLLTRKPCTSLSRNQHRRRAGRANGGRVGVVETASGLQRFHEGPNQHYLALHQHRSCLTTKLKWVIRPVIFCCCRVDVYAPFSFPYPYGKYCNQIQPGDPMYEPPPISPPSLYMDGAAIPKPPPAMRKRTEDLKVVPETAPLPPNPNDWIPQEVKRWLKSENLDEFIDVFYANGFDGAKMMTLSASQFVAGGFDEAACNLLGQAMERLKQSLDKKKKARAVYEYVGQKPGQLSLREGEIVTVLDDKKAWWKARNSQGQEGKVPSNYLEIVPDEEVSAVVEPQQLHYYHPNISRQEAEQKVAESREVGSFLIRESSTGEGFTLTAKTATGVMNLKVTKDGNHYVLGLFSGRYTNLDDLIQFHRSNPIRIANKDPMMLTMAVRRQ